MASLKELHTCLKSRIRVCILNSQTVRLSGPHLYRLQGKIFPGHKEHIRRKFANFLNQSANIPFIHAD